MRGFETNTEQEWPKIFNADKTGLFWRLLPNKAMAFIISTVTQSAYHLKRLTFPYLG